MFKFFKLCVSGFLIVPSCVDFVCAVLRRYLRSDMSEYWKGDIEAALQPHPVVILGSTTLNTPELTESSSLTIPLNGNGAV